MSNAGRARPSVTRLTEAMMWAVTADVPGAPRRLNLDEMRRDIERHRQAPGAARWRVGSADEDGADSSGGQQEEHSDERARISR